MLLLPPCPITVLPLVQALLKVAAPRKSASGTRDLLKASLKTYRSALRHPPTQPMRTQSIRAHPPQPIRAHPPQPIRAHPPQPIRANPPQPIRANPPQPIRAHPLQPTRSRSSEPIRSQPPRPIRSLSSEPIRSKPAYPKISLSCEKLSLSPPGNIGSVLLGFSQIRSGLIRPSVCLLL